MMIFGTDVGGHMDVNQLITALATNGIGLVCAAGVLWFAYYRETKTLPKLMDTFAAAMTTFQGTVEEIQKSFESRQQKLVDAFSQQAREERTTCQRWHEENRQVLVQLMQEAKENRHYLRDLANQLTLAKAVEAKRRERGIKSQVELDEQEGTNRPA
jgi:Sec-independent protein translocase protein TatA